MPRITPNSDYTPSVGDLVSVGNNFVPRGIACVASVVGSGDRASVVLRGRNTSEEVQEFTDTIFYWRMYGLHKVDMPEPPVAVDQFVLSRNSPYGAGPFTVTRVSNSILYPSEDYGHHVIHFTSTSNDSDSDSDNNAHQEYWQTLHTDYGYRLPSSYSRTPMRRQSFDSWLDPTVEETNVPYAPAVGDVITVNERYENYYGPAPLTVDVVRPCGRCPDHYEYENRTVVEIVNADGTRHDHHLARWRERGMRRADGRRPGMGPVGSEPADANPPLVIPAGERYPITGERAEELSFHYDRNVYGSGTYGYAILSRTQDEARNNTNDGRALMHLHRGLVLMTHCQQSRRYGSWNFTLIDTAGAYDGNEDEGIAIGYDVDGFDPDGFDEEGYNADGYDSSGYNADGYNRDGYNVDGYDDEGYDPEGYDEDGVDRYGDSRYDDSSDSAGLHSWDYKPTPLFKAKADDPQPKTFYGIEIEMTSDCSPEEMDLIKDLGRAEELIYPKSDGSVAGFELNTHPMTWAWATAEFPFDIVKKLASEGASVNERENGIHVHVSRDGFSSEAHMFRWMKFVYRNQAHAERIAGRRSDQWAGFRDGHRETQKAHALNQMKLRARTERESRGERYRSRTGIDTDDTIASRYSAINTCNRHTLEVRIFASTTDPSVFRTRVGFVAASVEYTRQLTANAVAKGGWDWSAFRTWLLENRETYPDLAAFEKVVQESEKTEAKREVQGEQRRRLRREWMTSDELLSFAEFLSRHDSSEETVEAELF
jgi:hypothetical protein